MALQVLQSSRSVFVVVVSHVCKASAQLCVIIFSNEHSANSAELAEELPYIRINFSIRDILREIVDVNGIWFSCIFFLALSFFLPPRTPLASNGDTTGSNLVKNSIFLFIL